MSSPVIRGAGICVDRDLRTVSTDAGPVHLTNAEYELLEALATRRRAVTYEALILTLYPDPDDEPGDPDGMVKVTICTLRRRLRAAGAADVIRTVRSIGYVFAGHSGAS